MSARRPRPRIMLVRSRPWGLVLAAAAATAACVAADPPPGPRPAPPRPAEGPPPRDEPAPPAAPTPVTPTPSPAPVVAPTPAPTPAPGGPGVAPPPTYPVGALDLPCTVRAELEAKVVKGELRLRFVLVNLGADATTVTLAGRCPGGPVALRGLPDGFDPMHTCRAGACADPTPTTTHTLGGRSSIVLGETVLSARGDACNPPLPAGSTFLTAAVTAAPARHDVCSGAPLHLVRDPESGALRRAGPREPPVPAGPGAPAPRPPAKPTPPPPTPPVKQPVKPRASCPACGIGCPDGIPSSKRGPDGCPVCACERFDLRP